MNKITIQGRITKDIELGHSQSGNAYARFSVAVDRRIRKDEERKTDFFDCVAFGKTAEFIEQYFHKGDGILINGRMESNQWKDKDGNNRLSWSVSIDDVEFPLGKKNGGDSNSTPESNNRPAYTGTSVADAVNARNAAAPTLPKTVTSNGDAPQAHYPTQQSWEEMNAESDLPF